MTMDRPLETTHTIDRPQIVMLDTDDGDAFVQSDPGVVVLTCANCGAKMDERKCKLICRCGYFLSCSDYY
jgi:hypothetical protein